MDIGVELHILDHRLRILSLNKKLIKNFMFEIIKIAFTNKTQCKFFSFIETNEDYSIIVDEDGYKGNLNFFFVLNLISFCVEFSNYINEPTKLLASKELWIPMFICGDDIPSQNSISKIAKYIISPLADSTISIMAVSTYQCDYILVRYLNKKKKNFFNFNLNNFKIQEKDYESVIKCLSFHIPKIYDVRNSARLDENNSIKENYLSNSKNKKNIGKKKDYLGNIYYSKVIFFFKLD